LDEEDILPGQDWDFEIRKAIRASDIVLVCLSETSANKVGYLQREIRSVLDIADEQPEGSIFLIPVRLEPVKVPERLRRWQWVDLFEESGYPRLMRALQTRIRDEPPTVPKIGAGMTPRGAGGHAPAVISRVRFGEGEHAPAEVTVAILPDQHDRGGKLISGVRR
jgi:TIR domain